MALSTDDAARLALLKSAYDKIITGAKVSNVTLSDGRRIDYVPTELALPKLKAEIDQLLAASSDKAVTRGSLRFRI